MDCAVQSEVIRFCYSKVGQFNRAAERLSAAFSDRLRPDKTAGLSPLQHERDLVGNLAPINRHRRVVDNAADILARFRAQQVKVVEDNLSLVKRLIKSGSDSRPVQPPVYASDHSPACGDAGSRSLGADSGAIVPQAATNSDKEKNSKNIEKGRMMTFRPHLSANKRSIGRGEPVARPLTYICPLRATHRVAPTDVRQIYSKTSRPVFSLS